MGVNERNCWQLYNIDQWGEYYHFCVKYDLFFFHFKSQADARHVRRLGLTCQLFILQIQVSFMYKFLSTALRTRVTTPKLLSPPIRRTSAKAVVRKQAYPSPLTKFPPP